MAVSKLAGKRHRLLIYQRSMDRLWRYMLVLDLVLWPAWWRAGQGLVGGLEPPKDLYLMFAAFLATGIFFFAVVARWMGYVQALRDHIYLSMPFMHLRISYRRVKSARPTELQQVFTPGTLSWADKRFLESMLGTTAIALILNSYPVSRAALRLFLPKVFFLPKEVGFVLAVKDWMTLSSEIDSLFGAWQESQQFRQESHLSRGMWRE